MRNKVMGIEKFTVRTSEADPWGYVRADALLNLMQESASRNADNLGFGYDDMRGLDTYWVLSRLASNFLYYPTIGSEIILQTWPSGIKGPYAYRNFTLSSGDEEFCTATSSWLILDANTKRPRRPESFMHEHDMDSMAFEAQAATVQSLVKLPSVADGNLIGESPVQYTDLDINYHMNNVKMIERTLNAIPLSIWDGSKLTRLEANFMAEVTLDDQLLTTITASDLDIEPGGSILTEVVTTPSKRVACKVRTTWEKQRNG